jgi:hypothetical protein
MIFDSFFERKLPVCEGGYMTAGMLTNHSKVIFLSVCFLLLFLAGSPTALAQCSSQQKETQNSGSNDWKVGKTEGKIQAKNISSKTMKTVFTDVDAENQISSYEIASLVGPFLSVAESLYWEGGAHPGHLARLVTVNLDTGRSPVLLTDIFPEKDIVRALLKDRFIRKHATGRLPGTLDDIRNLDGGCEVGFDLINESFVFHHVRGDEVAVRIGLPHGCEAMRGTYTELGVYLPIPPPLAGSFGRAERNRTLGRHFRARPNGNP